MLHIRSKSPSSKHGGTIGISDFLIKPNPQAFKPQNSLVSRSYSNRSSIDDSQYVKNAKNIIQNKQKKWDEESGNISSLRMFD